MYLCGGNFFFNMFVHSRLDKNKDLKHYKFLKPRMSIFLQATLCNMAKKSNAYHRHNKFCLKNK